MPIRLFKERVICNWRKFIRMSIRRSRYPAKLTKSRQAMRSGRASTGLERRVLAIALAPSELIGVAETARARYAGCQRRFFHIRRRKIMTLNPLKARTGIAALTFAAAVVPFVLASPAKAITNRMCT